MAFRWFDILLIDKCQDIRDLPVNNHWHNREKGRDRKLVLRTLKNLKHGNGLCNCTSSSLSTIYIDVNFLLNYTSRSAFVLGSTRCRALKPRQPVYWVHSKPLYSLPQRRHVLNDHDNDIENISTDQRSSGRCLILHLPYPLTFPEDAINQLSV